MEARRSGLFTRLNGSWNGVLRQLLQWYTNSWNLPVMQCVRAFIFMFTSREYCLKIDSVTR